MQRTRTVKVFNYEKAQFMLMCFVALVVIACHMAISIAIIMGW